MKSGLVSCSESIITIPFAMTSSLIALAGAEMATLKWGEIGEHSSLCTSILQLKFANTYKTICMHMTALSLRKCVCVGGAEPPLSTLGCLSTPYPTLISPSLFGDIEHHVVRWNSLNTIQRCLWHGLGQCFCVYFWGTRSHKIIVKIA